MIYLSYEDVVELHRVLIKKFGGLPGFRDKGLLESALVTPMMAVFGEELHKSVYDKGAAYLFSISRNHPFNDGNKRTAASVTLIFLRVNGKTPQYDAEEYSDFVADIAEGKFSIQDISNYLESLCSPFLNE